MDFSDRRIIIGIAALGAILLLVVGFFVGRSTSSSDDVAAAETTTTTTATTTTVDPTEVPTGDPSIAFPVDPVDDAAVPEYGEPTEREEFVAAMAGSAVVMGDRVTLLRLADRVCYDLERLQTQGRHPAFAVRVVWNDTLSALESQDLAAFAVIFNAAPFYLCPDASEYAEDVAYWLGY